MYKAFLKSVKLVNISKNCKHRLGHVLLLRMDINLVQSILVHRLRWFRKQALESLHYRIQLEDLLPRNWTIIEGVALSVLVGACVLAVVSWPIRSWLTCRRKHTDMVQKLVSFFSGDPIVTFVFRTECAELVRGNWIRIFVTVLFKSTLKAWHFVWNSKHHRFHKSFTCRNKLDLFEWDSSISNSNLWNKLEKLNFPVSFLFLGINNFNHIPLHDHVDLPVLKLNLLNLKVGSENSHEFLWRTTIVPFKVEEVHHVFNLA